MGYGRHGRISGNLCRIGRAVDRRRRNGKTIVLFVAEPLILHRRARKCFSCLLPSPEAIGMSLAP